MPMALDAIILAAGKGTRMNSDLPKVVHEVAGRPMVSWVVDAAREAGAGRCVVVVGYEAERVRAALVGQPGVEFVDQPEQKGTGHAVMMAEPAFADGKAGETFVLAGDMPLLRGRTLAKLVAAHRAAGAAGSIATGRLDDPTGYGRIVRDADGQFQRIVEHKDATEAERAIDEVNISCYCFDAPRLFDALRRVSTDNVQGEYYLTDVLEILRRDGRPAIAADIVPPDEVEGVNNPDQLARVDRILRGRPQTAASQTKTTS